MGRQTTLDIADIKWVREQTGAGVMEAKRALEEAGGNREEALRILQLTGAATAEKKAGRTTENGAVASYIHHTGTIGVLVELDCETDFTARSEQFRALARDIAMHICAASPKYTSQDEIPETDRQQLLARFEQEAREEGKPENRLPQIAEGKFRKWTEQNVLYNQPFIRDQDKSIEQIVHDLVLQVKENIVIKRWCRFQIGV